MEKLRIHIKGSCALKMMLKFFDLKSKVHDFSMLMIFIKSLWRGDDEPPVFTSVLYFSALFLSRLNGLKIFYKNKKTRLNYKTDSAERWNAPNVSLARLQMGSAEKLFLATCINPSLKNQYPFNCMLNLGFFHSFNLLPDSSLLWLFIVFSIY